MRSAEKGPPEIRANGRCERLERRGGLALGLLQGKRYSASETPFAAGDLLAIYTDGITEAPAPDGQQFGEERLKAMLTAQRAAPLARLSDELLAAVGSWQGGDRRFDDVTLLLARASAPVGVLELPAKLESIEVVVDAVGDCAKRCGFDQPATQKIVLAVCEAVTNIITHALAADPKRSFRVFFGRTGDALVVRCEDEGPLFDRSLRQPARHRRIRCGRRAAADG